MDLVDFGVAMRNPWKWLLALAFVALVATCTLKAEDGSGGPERREDQLCEFPIEKTVWRQSVRLLGKGSDCWTLVVRAHNLGMNDEKNHRAADREMAILSKELGKPHFKCKYNSH